MKTLVLTMLLTLILNGCRNGVNINLKHTEKSYSPVFSYFPNGEIDTESSYCIVSAQHFSLSGHQFLDAKKKEPIQVCDRAIGYKGGALYGFFNLVALEIQKGLGFKSGKSNEALRSVDSSKDEQRYKFSQKNRSGY